MAVKLLYQQIITSVTSYNGYINLYEEHCIKFVLKQYYTIL